MHFTLRLGRAKLFLRSVVGHFAPLQSVLLLRPSLRMPSSIHIPSMTTKRIKRPRGPIQLGKLIVDIATGQVEDRVDDGRDSAAAELGRRGGNARAALLTSEQRAFIARKAAKNGGRATHSAISAPQNKYGTAWCTQLNLQC